MRQDFHLRCKALHEQTSAFGSSQTVFRYDRKDVIGSDAGLSFWKVQNAYEWLLTIFKSISYLLDLLHGVVDIASKCKKYNRRCRLGIEKSYAWVYFVSCSGFDCF